MRTIIIIIYLILLFIYSLFMIIVDKLLGVNEIKVYNKVQQIAKSLDKIAGNNYVLQGAENITGEPCLIVANHESIFDPVAIVDIFDQPIGLIGKIELKKIPTLSYWITKFGCEFIDRDDMKQSMRVIINASKTLESGRSVLIFPEGTRSIEDKEFKAGSLKIAQNAKAPILPITIRNTSQVFEQNKWFMLTKAKPTIKIHKQIEYQDYKQYDLLTVATNVQKIINDVK